MKVIPNNGLIDVPLTQFTETNKLVILRNFDKLDFDIAVVKLGENQYKALEMQCTHVPNNHLVATDSGFHCNTHGSSFSFDGQVVESPAQRPMKEFPIEINNHTIQIKL
jgi:Rieske Fe-S protein